MIIEPNIVLNVSDTDDYSIDFVNENMTQINTVPENTFSVSTADTDYLQILLNPLSDNGIQHYLPVLDYLSSQYT